MKKHILLLLSIIWFSSCSSSKTVVKKDNEISYTSFRSMQKSFASKDGNLKYIDKGKGGVIVLLHGVPTSGWIYRNFIDKLSKTHRVIVPDMLGFGSSDSPKGYELYSEKNHAKRLLSLMEHLQIENWSQVIHDAAGLWTWELFEMAPNKINNLVVLNSIIYEEGFAPPIRFKKGAFAKMAMWSYSNKITTNMMVNKLFKAGMIENNLSKEALNGYKTPLKEGKTKAMYYFFTQTCNSLKNYQNTIQNIEIPVTVIWGTEDSFLKWHPQEHKITKDISIKNTILIDAKHFIQEEKPTKISEMILKAL